MKGKFSIKINIFLCFAAMFLFCVFSIQADAEEIPDNTIRVAFPIQEGLTMRDEDGKLSGYSYDYLMEISQYTGWNYEFIFVEDSIDVQLNTMMEMLKKGEIDIMGALYYDESLSDVYAYSGYSIGMNYYGLFVPEESKLRESSLYNSKSLKVGVHSKSNKRSDLLDQYAKMNNISIEQVITDTADEFYDLVEDGKADALLSTDVAMANHKNMFAVAHFSPKPFYFVTTLGNTDIVRKLNYAISTIDQVNPNYTQQLYNQYFSKSSDDILLSDEEKSFLESCGTLEVVMYDNKPPFQYIDSKTGKPTGITVEILELVGEKVGLDFHYNTVSTYQDYISFIQNNKADIAADALINFQDAKDTGTLLTLPWCELPIVTMFQEEQVYNEDGRAAIPYFLRNVVDKTENITYFDSVEECLKAVQRGDADYSYIGDFCSQYFSNNSSYKSMYKLNNSDIDSQKLCFGICDNTDLDLLMIFNKGISALPKETINEIIYRNAYQPQPMTFADYIRNNRNFLITSALSMFTTILVIWFIIKNRQQQRLSFENKRYAAISNLANEYFYEYNVAEDNLILSEKCALYFSCDQNIPKFSRKLAAISEAENVGIWQLGQYIISNSEGSLELSCEMPDHSRQWVKIFSSNIHNKKKQIHGVGKITDIQEVKAEQIRLEQKASIDSLTGIYNIATVKGLIRNYLEQLDNTAHSAFVILDIDNFKQVNDSFGHHMGDAVLTQAAGLITAMFPDHLTGRLGGDEFIIFIQNMTMPELEKRCRLLCRNMMEKTHEMLGMSFSLSIGITWAQKGKSYETLYQEADTALYKTKDTSKNGFSFYKT